MIPRLLLPALPALALLLAGCSIENEYEEKITVKAEEPQSGTSDPKTAEFVFKAQQCVLGKADNAEELLALFKASLKGTEDHLRYQDPEAVAVLEKCLRKTDAAKGSKLYIGYVPAARQCAGIAQAFFAAGDNDAGNFWLRRVVNQLGLAGGYELAGTVFVEDDKTLSLGARLLGEAARQGSDNAAHTLMELSSGM